MTGTFALVAAGVLILAVLVGLRGARSRPRTPPPPPFVVSARRAGDVMLVLLDPGPYKTRTIKHLRLATGRGLRDLKSLVDRAPVDVGWVRPADGDRLRRALDEDGARAELRDPASTIGS